MSCSKPTAKRVSASAPKEERQAQREINRLEALADGDLVCHWKQQTIAGQSVQSTTLVLFNDVLMLIDLSLDFPMNDHKLRRDMRTAASGEIAQIVAALSGKYGKSHQLIQYGANSMVRDYWYLPDGEILVERKHDLPYHATVRFKAKEYEAERGSRAGAASAIRSALYNAHLRKAESERVKNLKDL